MTKPNILERILRGLIALFIIFVAGFSLILVLIPGVIFYLVMRVLGGIIDFLIMLVAPEVAPFLVIYKKLMPLMFKMYYFILTKIEDILSWGYLGNYHLANSFKKFK